MAHSPKYYGKAEKQPQPQHPKEFFIVTHVVGNPLRCVPPSQMAEKQKDPIRIPTPNSKLSNVAG
jgi:hypothetical protein